MLSFSMIVVAMAWIVLMVYEISKKKRSNKPTSLIPKGWTIAMIDGVAQDVAPSQFDISKLKRRAFLKVGEWSISVEEVRKRAVEFKSNHGLADGKRMIVEQDKIPIEFRGFCIMLPGTILCDSRGNLRLALLEWGVDGWVLFFGFLPSVWYVGRYDICCFACIE